MQILTVGWPLLKLLVWILEFCSSLTLQKFLKVKFGESLGVLQP